MSSSPELISFSPRIMMSAVAAVAILVGAVWPKHYGLELQTEQALAPQVQARLTAHARQLSPQDVRQTLVLERLKACADTTGIVSASAAQAVRANGREPLTVGQQQALVQSIEAQCLTPTLEQVALANPEALGAFAEALQRAGYALPARYASLAKADPVALASVSL